MSLDAGLVMLTVLLEEVGQLLADRGEDPELLSVYLEGVIGELLRELLLVDILLAHDDIALALGHPRVEDLDALILGELLLDGHPSKLRELGVALDRHDEA